MTRNTRSTGAFRSCWWRLSRCDNPPAFSGRLRKLQSCEPIDPLLTLPSMSSLPHDIPPWVDPSKEIYFVTINCQKRRENQLALPHIAQPLFETVRHRQERFLWWPSVFLLMPDHLHGLLSFPPSGKPVRRVVRNWKEWTAKELGIEWQDDFFEHRLRREESRREKADYILANPVRAGLVKRALDWPFVYFGDGRRPDFFD
jgi:REP-associated tyrosine transposase